MAKGMLCTQWAAQMEAIWTETIWMEANHMEANGQMRVVLLRMIIPWVAEVLAAYTGDIII